MKPDAPGCTFTVFTPTFNRAHSLPRVYQSLRAQTFTDFEWLIVDDGSTDNTSALVQAWMPDAPFTIRYFHQPNSGKHVADNLAAQEAHGRFYATLDSDDWYLAITLERFLSIWESIAADDRDSFVGGVGICADPHGSVIGTRFPEDVLDTTYTELRTKYAVRGDKAGFGRTEIVRQFPFPVIPGEQLIVEELVYNRIARHYCIRCVNEVLKINDYQSGGLSALSSSLFIRNPRTAKLCFFEQLSERSLSSRARLRAYAQHTRYALHAGLLSQSQSDSPSKILWALSLPIALALYIRDRLFLRDAC